MRWNLSSRARDLSDGAALVLSIPKSGRTWLRTFVSAYFARKTDRPFALDLTMDHALGIPRIIYSHDWFEHRSKGSTWDRLRGKYLVPKTQTRAPILLLARDPRDAFVSYLVQLTRRNPATPAAIKQLQPGALLRHPRFGIEVMIEVMNRWLREFGGRRDFSIVRYEELRANPATGFERVLRALGESEIHRPSFEHALAFSEFSNMRQMEASGGFATKILQPRDQADAESFKVRRGKVGGFGDYLSPADQEYAARACRALDSRFGYRV